MVLTLKRLNRVVQFHPLCVLILFLTWGGFVCSCLGELSAVVRKPGGQLMMLADKPTHTHKLT